MNCNLIKCPYSIPGPPIRICGDSKTNFVNECPCQEEKIATQESSKVVKCKGVLNSEDYSRLQMFLARVNKVTAYHRHGLSIPKKALDTLSNEQIDMEKWLEDKKNNLTQENQK